MTHPLVVSEVGADFKGRRAAAAYSMEIRQGVGSMERIAEGLWSGREMEALEIPMADFNESVLISYPEGKMARQFHIARGIRETGALINICKMKIPSVGADDRSREKYVRLYPGAS